MKKVTLVGKLSLSVGKHRFIQNQTVLVSDPKVIEYVTGNPNFSVSDAHEGSAKAKPARGAKAEKPAEEEAEKPSRPVKPAAE